MPDSFLQTFFERDRKLAFLIFAISFLIGFLGLTTLDFVLISFSGLTLQFGVIFFIGISNFKEFFTTAEQKIAALVMFLGVLVSLNHFVILGSLMEWGGFLYLFGPFRGLFKAVFGGVMGGV